MHHLGKAAGSLLALLLAMAPMAEAAELPVTSSFGWRTHPISGEQKFHTGLDLGYPSGTQVPSMFDGVVVQAGDFSDGYGNQVLVYHPSLDCYTRYAHLSSVAVDVDVWLLQRACIGWVGETGNATGPHLHLEYIVRGADGGFVFQDPLSLWMTQEG